MKLQTKTRARPIYTFSPISGFLQQTHFGAGGRVDHYTEAVHPGSLQVQTPLLAQGSLSLSIFISRYDLFFSLVRFACERSGDCYYHYPYYFCNCRYSSCERATNFVKQTLTRQFGHQLLLERNNFQSSNFL